MLHKIGVIAAGGSRNPKNTSTSLDNTQGMSFFRKKVACCLLVVNSTGIAK